MIELASEAVLLIGISAHDARRMYEEKVAPAGATFIPAYPMERLSQQTRKRGESGPLERSLWLVVRPDRTVVGYVVVTTAGHPADVREIFLVEIAEAFRNQELATEALRLVIEWLGQQADIERVRIQPINNESRGLAMKLGFQPIDWAERGEMWERPVR